MRLAVEWLAVCLVLCRPGDIVVRGVGLIFGPGSRWPVVSFWLDNFSRRQPQVDDQMATVNFDTNEMRINEGGGSDESLDLGRRHPAPAPREPNGKTTEWRSLLMMLLASSKNGYHSFAI